MTKRILQLDNQLANQIAAGEVVERPASVVKELIENSIDAGATRIAIDVERGGTRLIRIIDDGSGIHPDDMGLALSRHATSKISQFAELCAVQTLGFRGEALASIASVAKLLLRSRMKGEEQGWQAVAEGRDMAVTVTPAAATEGTCVEIRDLFYNTPARRKFLRTEKTELAHIEDVVKREALAAPGVAFVLKNNGSVTKRYPLANDPLSMQQKLIAACGNRFIKQATEFSGEIDELKIRGWVGSPNYHRSESDTQLIFVNNRPVKDRMLSHAVRQSYSGLIPTGRFATYVIYIDCPANLVDVNVHPTKHEVKFAQPRQVHDFLVKLISDALQQTSLLDLNEERREDNFLKHPFVEEKATNNPTVEKFIESKAVLDEVAMAVDPISRSASEQRLSSPQRSPQSRSSARSMDSQSEIAEHRSFYQQIVDSVQSTEPNSHQSQRAGNQSVKNKSRELWQQRYLAYPQSDRLWIIDVWRWIVDETRRQWTSTSLPAKPLLIPRALTIQQESQFEDAKVFERFLSLGIEFTPCSPDQVLLRKLPAVTTPVTETTWVAALQLCLQRTGNELEQVTNMQSLILSCLEESLPENSGQLVSWCESQLSTGREIETKTSDIDWRKFAWSISAQKVAQQIGR